FLSQVPYSNISLAVRCRQPIFVIANCYAFYLAIMPRKQNTTLRPECSTQRLFCHGHGREPTVLSNIERFQGKQDGTLWFCICKQQRLHSKLRGIAFQTSIFRNGSG